MCNSVWIHRPDYAWTMIYICKIRNQHRNQFTMILQHPCCGNRIWELWNSSVFVRAWNLRAWKFEIWEKFMSEWLVRLAWRMWKKNQENRSIGTGNIKRKSRIYQAISIFPAVWPLFHKQIQKVGSPCLRCILLRKEHSTIKRIEVVRKIITFFAWKGWYRIENC